jgi:hypothetical protein
MAAAFDTLKAATRLREEAGFEERQATVLVELFADRYGDRENLATRDDVAAVRGEVTMLRDDVTVLRGDVTVLRDDVTVMRGEMTVMRGDLEKTELTLRGDLEKNDASLRGEIHKLRGEMHKQGQLMTTRLGAAIAAAVAIIVALDKLL